MPSSVLTNFSITDPHFVAADVSQIIWKNDDAHADLIVAFSETTFSGHHKLIQPALDDSWQTLAGRAAASLPPGDTFRFYNSEILKWSAFDSDSHTITVEKGMFYKDITAVRSQQSVYDQIPAAERPSAFVLMNILVTADNKIILGRRPYFGDWPHDRFECPGSFLKEKHVVHSSLTEVARGRVYDDYLHTPDLVLTPLLICDLPRVMETLLLYVSKVAEPAANLVSDCYTDFLTLDNSPAGLKELQSSPLELFHPPSRVALQLYFENSLSV